MKAVVVKPGEKAQITEIDESLEDLQAIVGGYIEALYPYDDLVGIVCNEEGKLTNLPMNRVLFGEGGEVVDIIFGTFIICGLDNENACFASLSDELAEKYCEKFLAPETFARTVTGGIVVTRIQP